MSEEALKLIRDVEESMTQRISRSAKLLYLVIGAVIGGTVWFTTMQLTVASLKDDNIVGRANDKAFLDQLNEIALWKTELNASRYTLRDHAEDERKRAEREAQQDALDNERILLQEKRLQRLEDNQARLIDITEKLANTK